MGIGYGKHVDQNGNIRYFKNYQLHREDGPAYVAKIEGANIIGYSCWWLNGKIHREDGPAVVSPGGGKEYYIDNKQLTELEFFEWKLKNILK